MADDSNSSEEKSLSWTLVAALLVVGLIVAMGVVLSISGLKGDDGEDATPPPTASSTSSSSSTSADSDSVCGLPGHQTTGTVSHAPDATWRLVGSIAAPHVEGSGPGEIDAEGFGYCFAHTPEGAVVAAAGALAFTATNEVRTKWLKKSTVPGPGRTAALEEMRSGASEEVPDGASIQVAGFQMTSYSGTEAIVDVVIETNGRYYSQMIDLRWVGGDWKVRLTDSGEFTSESRQIPDLAGYIPWSGA